MNQVYTMKPSSRVDDVLLKQQESMVPQDKMKWLPAQTASSQKWPKGGKSR
jgi:hypothetical protein